MMKRSAVAVVRCTGDDFGKYASITKSSASNTAPTAKKYRARGISGSLRPQNTRTACSTGNGPICSWPWWWQTTKLPLRCGRYQQNGPDLDVAGREQRALRLAGVNVDEADM